MLNTPDKNELNSQADYARQLERYSQKITNILESFTDGFFEVDREWKVTYWNKEAEQLMMMPREEIMGKNLWEVYHEAIVMKFYSEYHRAVSDNTAVRFEEYFEPKNIWLEVAAFPSGDGLSVYFKDITERKHASAILEQEKKKFQDLFNLSPIPQWVYDLDNLKFLQVNQAAILFYGYSRKEFLSMTIKDIRPREELAVLQDIIVTKVKKGFYSQSAVKHQKKNGEIIFVTVQGNSVSFEGKNARLVLAIDQTQKILAERELQKSLNRYDIVSKATSDAVWDWDIKSGQVIWNMGIQDIFGYQEVQSDYKWWESNVHPDDIDHVKSQMQSLIDLKKSRNQVEYRFRCADGNYKNILDRSFILFGAENEALRVIGSMQDITERIEHLRAAESQNAHLREISWLQSHMVRAPLARIMGLAGLLGDVDCSDVEETKQLSVMMLDSAEELDQVIREIMKKMDNKSG